jgi:LysM repeat protein
MWKLFSHSIRRIGVISVIMMIGLCAAAPSHSAPSEEDISGSASVRTPRNGNGVKGVQGGWSEPSPDNPAFEQSDQAETGDEAPPARGAESSPHSVPSPRAFFPYTIRAGDTPGGIAALFGIPIAELMKVNHLGQDSELTIGDTLRVPNPFLARERELTSEVDRLTTDQQASQQRAKVLQDSIAGLHSQVQDLNDANRQYRHDLRILPWWRATALLTAGAAAAMLCIMLVAVVQWIIARSRFRAVAEMNESLRRLDHKYKAALAKAELRFQELYGRRRGGIVEGQDRSKTPEEREIEQLNRQLKDVLERHLQRLEPSSSAAGRARWRERLAGIGAPMEVRSIRR